MAISQLRSCDPLNSNPNVKCSESTVGIPSNKGHAIDKKLMTELDGKSMTEPSDAPEATYKFRYPTREAIPKQLKLPVNLLQKEVLKVRKSIQEPLIQRRGLLVVL